jgi:nucleotide-binding universal stress UspA family protein
MGDPEMNSAINKSQLLLEEAKELSRELGVEASPQLRIEYDVAQGISHTSREQDASLIVLGMSGRKGFTARLFGNVTNSVLWKAHCPVAVTRLFDSPLTIQRILVPVENLTPSALRPVRFAQILAEVNQAHVTLLHVCDPRASQSKIAWTRSQLELIASKGTPNTTPIEVQIKPHENVRQAILNASQSHDLVVLRSQQGRMGAEGLRNGETIAPLVQQLTCSVVMLGEPLGTPTSVLAHS